MAEYEQKPVLKNTDTGKTLTLYFDDFNEGAEDYTVRHHPPSRSGDIEQDMGHGSDTYRGTIAITETMHPDGIEGYKEDLKKMARTDFPLEMTLDDGTTVECTLREPEFDKSAGNAPNQIKVNGVEISELDQPVNTF